MKTLTLYNFWMPLNQPGRRGHWAPRDTLVLAPPFICEPRDIDAMVGRLRDAIVSTRGAEA